MKETLLASVITEPTRNYTVAARHSWTFWAPWAWVGSWHPSKGLHASSDLTPWLITNLDSMEVSGSH